MGCCESLLKYLVFLFNLVFFICGGVIVGVGVYLQIEMNNYLNFLDQSYVNSSTALIILGVIVVLVTFFGCCGACTENSVMMYIFGFLMTVLLIAELGAGITVLVYKNDINDLVTKNLEAGLDNYNDPDYAGVKATWDLVQKDLHCCGVESDNDWAKVLGQSNVPDSCCMVELEGCGNGNQGKSEVVYTRGCLKPFMALIKDNMVTVGGVAAGIAVIQILGIVFGCCLGRRMGAKNQYV